MRASQAPSIASQLEDVPCDLCGLQDEEFLYTKPGHLTGHPFRLVRCRACGLLYLNPRLNSAGLTQLYDRAYYQGQGFDSKVDYLNESGGTEEEHFTPELIMRFLQSHMAPGARLLDYGSGSGRLIRAAVRAGYQAEGYEVSPFAAGYARDRGANVYTDTGQIPDNTYDVVTAVEVLEHCYSPTDALRVIYRALKPGGLFFYTTENFDKFYARWRRGVVPPQDAYVVPEGHIYFYTSSVMRAYFQKTGFSQVFSWDSPIYVKNSWAYRILAGLDMTDPEQEMPRNLWERFSYFKLRRLLELFGSRPFLPLARK